MDIHLKDWDRVAITLQIPTKPKMYVGVCVGRDAYAKNHFLIRLNNGTEVYLIAPCLVLG